MSKMAQEFEKNIDKYKYDLYEACKEALRTIAQFERVIEWEEHCPVYFIVEKAIAKVENLTGKS